MGKRRFGISLPEDLAASLDELANKLEVDRSTLITEVLREFVHDRIHVLTPHHCRGVLIVVSGDKHASQLASMYEKYQKMVKARMHCHSENNCIDVLIVEANSDDILNFKRELLSLKIKVRYLPLQWDI